MVPRKKAVTEVSAGSDAVPLMVNGAGWHRRRDTGLGSRAAKIGNVRVVQIMMLIVGREGVKLVDVVAEGKLFGWILQG